jgi:hypothetical protein
MLEKESLGEMVEKRSKQVKPHNPVFAATLEKVHESEGGRQRVIRDRRSRRLLKIHTAQLANL